ncbi:MAG TPA: hypothetical protein VJL56_06905 [Candidatus Bathyarchaeia archaeon]|nr:hypothetical protein [Candidatus Bathyarchaeia archaeon]
MTVEVLLVQKGLMFASHLQETSLYRRNTAGISVLGTRAAV